MPHRHQAGRRRGPFVPSWASWALCEPKKGPTSLRGLFSSLGLVPVAGHPSTSFAGPLPILADGEAERSVVVAGQEGGSELGLGAVVALGAVATFAGAALTASTAVLTTTSALAAAF